MTGSGIIGAIIGFIVCAIIFGLVGILILGIIWWTFKHDMDFDDIANMEGPDND